MVRRLAVAVALLVVLPATPASAAAEVPVTVEGGTPAERQLIVDVMSWPELPPLRQPIAVVVADSGSSFAGCGGIVLGSVSEVSILHEYGHVWDCQTLDQGWRRFVMDCGDGDCLTGHDAFGWGGASYDVRPSERFAQSFAAEVEYRRHGTRTPLWWVLYPPKLIGRTIDALAPCGAVCL